MAIWIKTTGKALINLSRADRIYVEKSWGKFRLMADNEIIRELSSEKLADDCLDYLYNILDSEDKLELPEEDA